MGSKTVALLDEELRAHVAALTNPGEGWRDLERALNKPEEQAAKAAINMHITLVQKRLDLIDIAQKALKALAEHGYDTIPVLQLSAANFDVVKANDDSINAAMALTKPLAEPATTADFTPGKPRPKDVPPVRP